MSDDESEGTPLRVHGNAITGIIRTLYEQGKWEPIAEMCPELPIGTVLEICQGKAEIIGDDIDGYSIHRAEDDDE